jgi:hypothetical protein
MSAWHRSDAAPHTTIFSLSTDDPLLSTVTFPTPTVVIVFGAAEKTPAVTPQPASPASSFSKWLPRHLYKDVPKTPGNQVELIIDSLPNHELTEPIPVIIDMVGDALCTASMRNLDISTPGNSIGDALLQLKTQIEFVYDGLNRRPHLSADQKTILQMLHTYIAPPSKKPERPLSGEATNAAALGATRAPPPYPASRYGEPGAKPTIFRKPK